MHTKNESGGAETEVCPMSKQGGESSVIGRSALEWLRKRWVFYKGVMVGGR